MFEFTFWHQPRGVLSPGTIIETVEIPDLDGRERIVAAAIGARHALAKMGIGITRQLQMGRRWNKDAGTAETLYYENDATTVHTMSPDSDPERVDVWVYDSGSVTKFESKVELSFDAVEEAPEVMAESHAELVLVLERAIEAAWPPLTEEDERGY